MITHRLIPVVLLAGAVACGATPARRYELRGQVLAVDRAKLEITIKHEDIPGFMPAMTMPFRVKDGRLLDGRAIGDLVSATLVVEESDAYLTTITKTGFAEVASSEPPLPPAFAIDLLEPGDLVPDQRLVDQAGETRTLASWKGQVVALTFIYTRCPLPTFCPLMDRQFAAVQQALASDPALRGQVRLLSVSFDPDHDSPEVLRKHAALRGADPAVWSYVTAPRDEVDRFAAHFGMSIVRGTTPGDITHTLRTAVIDREGRLAALHTGNEWRPVDLLRDIRHAAAQR
jgi:protein SCO1/2